MITSFASLMLMLRLLFRLLLLPPSCIALRPLTSRPLEPDAPSPKSAVEELDEEAIIPPDELGARTGAVSLLLGVRGVGRPVLAEDGAGGM